MLMITISKTMSFSNGIPILGMLPTGYALGYVNDLFKILGENGRQPHLNTPIPVDMLYLVLFGLTHSLLLACFLKKLNKLYIAYGYLCYIPIVAGVADYFENFGIISMLKNYPKITELKTPNTTEIGLLNQLNDNENS